MTQVTSLKVFVGVAIGVSAGGVVVEIVSEAAITTPANPARRRVRRIHFPTKVFETLPIG